MSSWGKAQLLARMKLCLLVTARITKIIPDSAELKTNIKLHSDTNRTGTGSLV